MRHKPRIDPDKLRFFPADKDMIQELRKFKYPRAKKKTPVRYDHAFDPLFPGPKYGGIRRKEDR